MCQMITYSAFKNLIYISLIFRGTVLQIKGAIVLF